MTFRTIVALLAVVAIAACGGAATEEEVEGRGDDRRVRASLQHGSRFHGG